jgi:hypothetical protein
MDLSCVNGARGVHFDCSTLAVDAFDVAISYTCVHKNFKKKHDQVYLPHNSWTSICYWMFTYINKDVWFWFVNKALLNIVAWF